MWKPLSAISGAILLASGGIMYTQVKPVLDAERIQATNAAGYKNSAMKNLADCKNVKEAAESGIAAIKAKLDQSTAAKNEAIALLQTKTTETKSAVEAKDSAQKELDELESRLKDLGGLPALVADLKKLEGDRAALDSTVESAKSSIKSIAARRKEIDKAVSQLKKLDLWQQTGTMDAGFSTRVASVNSDYGFVVINAGDSSRVVRQAKLDVQRSGAKIGSLVVTHIESGRSVAEIVPGSIAAGDSIRPGDRVVVNEASKPSKLDDSTAKPVKAKTAPAAENAAPAATPAPAAPATDDPFATPSPDGSSPPATTTPEIPAVETPTPAADAMDKPGGN